MKNRKAGFTLIELIIAVVIIGILLFLGLGILALILWACGVFGGHAAAPAAACILLGL